MVISGVTTMLAIAAVLGVIGYRVFKAEGSTAEATALLPKGARVIATAATEDRLVVTVDPGEENADLELWAAERRVDLLARLLDRPVVFRAGSVRATRRAAQA